MFARTFCCAIALASCSGFYEVISQLMQTDRKSMLSYTPTRNDCTCYMQQSTVNAKKDAFTAS